jgi:ABC-type long-subunit fatty acid transport system fused permease/ATPase subunit
LLAVYQLYLNQWLQIRWRRWLTRHYLGEWMHGANHYRMQLQGDAADNPDQRIADDVKLFVERTLDIGLNLLNSVVTLFSFVIILWGLSEAAPLHVFGKEYPIPGYLVWGALIYAVFGTALTQWIGSPLVQLDFRQQRFEADFRFNLVRARENADLHGNRQVFAVAFDAQRHRVAQDSQGNLRKEADLRSRLDTRKRRGSFRLPLFVLPRFSPSIARLFVLCLVLFPMELQPERRLVPRTRNLDG